jgi:hypothetical protein
MKMLIDSSSGTTAQVHAEVKSTGLIATLQRLFAALGQQHHLAHQFGGAIGKIGEVLVGADQEMATGIRVDIQNDKIMDSAENDESLLVMLRGVLEAERASL